MRACLLNSLAMGNKRARALTIAGFDPSGGAGVSRDIKTFTALGVESGAVVACLTAQNEVGFSGALKIATGFIDAQFAAARAENVNSAKTGMLLDEETVTAVCRNIRNFSIKNVIADPVMQSSSGASLLTGNGVDALKKELLPLCGFVTPNIAEAEKICGGGKIETAKDVKNAAREIAALGAGKVVVTGGHLRDERIIDTFFDGAEFFEIGRERIGGEMHGSGCVFSSALCALKALGREDAEAVEQAGRFTAEEIKKSLQGGNF